MFDNKILEKLKLFVEEDIGYSDITTDTLINDDLKIQAEVTSQSSGIMAGLNLWKQFFINCNCDFKILVQDGDIVNNNQIIAEIQGSANKILNYERTFLKELIGKTFSDPAREARRKNFAILTFP